MGQTKRRYDIRIVAVLTQNHAPLASGHERAMEGDIIAVVGRTRDLQGVGRKETSNFLWLRIEGIEEAVYSTEGVEDGGTSFDKRRFSVPLERLKKICPWFDIDRARDGGDLYQPFFPLDRDDDLISFENTFLPGAKRPPLQAEGLIFDKVLGAYV